VAVNDPDAQGSQATEAGYAAKVPAEQSWHTDAPDDETKVPVGHAVQYEAPVPFE